MTRHSIADCLATLSVDHGQLAACETAVDEFRYVKRCYFRACLSTHPDKGGDTDAFRQVHAAFEVLKAQHQSGLSLAALEAAEAGNYEEIYRNCANMPVPSWEYYYDAAEEETPLYKVEPAKSGRSKCNSGSKCHVAEVHKERRKQEQRPIEETAIVNVQGSGKALVEREAVYINQDALRVGVLDSNYGSYGRWRHLECWRVPSRVWMGLPDPTTCKDPIVFERALLGMNEVLFCGLDKLDDEDKAKVVEFCMNKSHWAKYTKPREKKKKPSPSEVKTLVTVSDDVKAKKSPKKVFVMPEPGKNGVERNKLEGLRFVLTGVFPEVGGGKGLNLGRDRVSEMIENHGGITTSAVSGKTDFLIVGKEPGYKKVTEARKRGTKVWSLHHLKECLEGTRQLGETENMAIGNFSDGAGNSLARKAPAEDRIIAFAAAALMIESGSSKRPAIDQYEDETAPTKGSKSNKRAMTKTKRSGQTTPQLVAP